MSGNEDDYEAVEAQIAVEMYIDELEETVAKLEMRIKELTSNAD